MSRGTKETVGEWLSRAIQANGQWVEASSTNRANLSELRDRYPNFQFAWRNGRRATRLLPKTHDSSGEGDDGGKEEAL